MSVSSLVYEKIYENLLLCVLYAYMYDYLCSPLLFLFVGDLDLLVVADFGYSKGSSFYESQY